MHQGPVKSSGIERSGVLWRNELNWASEALDFQYAGLWASHSLSPSAPGPSAIIRQGVGPTHPWGWIAGVSSALK